MQIVYIISKYTPAKAIKHRTFECLKTDVHQSLFHWLVRVFGETKQFISLICKTFEGINIKKIYLLIKHINHLYFSIYVSVNRTHILKSTMID